MKNYLNPSTPFWQAVKAVVNKEISAPSVNYQGKPINYFCYQLALHKFELSLWSKGMRPNRHWRVSTLKNYYGISGKPDQLVEQIKDLIAHIESTNA